MYPNFFIRFPTASRHWSEYIEHELKDGNLDHVEAILKQVGIPDSPRCPSVRLYQNFIEYRKKRIAEQKDTLTPQRYCEQLIETYEIALRKAGHMLKAWPIWENYIALMKGNSLDVAFASKGVSKDVKRRALYRRAIAAPIKMVKIIWEDYQAFENGLASETQEHTKKLAEVRITQSSRLFIKAQQIAKEREECWKAIDPGMLSYPPPSPPSSQLMDQVVAWKDLVKLESRNPQGLEDQMFHDVVYQTYRQCLSCLRHFPEIWHDFATFALEKGDKEKATAVLEEGCAAIPDSLLLAFHLSQLEETADPTGHRASEVFERLLAQPFPDPIVFIEYQRMLFRTQGVHASRALFKRARKASWLTYHHFVAAASLEYHCNNAPNVARNIYSLGLKSYFDLNVPFVCEYVKFLVATGSDDSNIRGVFERILPELKKDRKEEARPLWEMYREFEYRTAKGWPGTCKSIVDVEKRMHEWYPQDPSLDGLARTAYRYRVHGLDASASNQSDRSFLTRWCPNLSANDAGTPRPASLPILIPGFLRQFEYLQAEDPAPDIDELLQSLAQPLPPRPLPPAHLADSVPASPRTRLLETKRKVKQSLSGQDLFKQRRLEQQRQK